MKRLMIRIRTSIALLFIVALTISCALPFLNKQENTVPPPIPTPPQVLETSPPVTTGSTPEPPSLVEEASAFAPDVGSKLRWVDFSDFVYVPYGEFIMGHDSLEPKDFNPEHKVTLSGFWVHQAEVTNQQYALCVAAGKCTEPYAEKDEPYRYGDARYVNYPVVGVDWYQASRYCEWIDARLPSEAEWEKSARGVEGKIYPWGDEAPTCDLLNFNDCLDPSEPDDVRTYNNGASPFEAMDMSGNVFEWVSDWYKEDYYLTSPAQNPTGPETGEKKGYRGGGYKTSPEEIMPWLRFAIEPEKHSEQLGFRCVLVGDLPSASIPPPPCAVVPLQNPNPGSGPFTPLPPCSPAGISAFCAWRGNSQVTGINISMGNCYGNDLIIYGNGNELDCEVKGSDPKQYLCEPPPGSAQGSTINIDYCYALPLIQLEIECPAGYQYNSASSLCEPEGSWLPDPPCPTGYLEFGGICLPDYFAHHGCPQGFYTVYFGKTAMCVPMDECLLPNPPESCTTAMCSEGEVYDPDNLCCVVPEKPRAVCPVGFVFDEIKKMCTLPNLFPSNCLSDQIKIPFCPTPTPTPTSPPPVIPCPLGNTTDPKICNTRYGNVCYWNSALGACLQK